MARGGDVFVPGSHLACAVLRRPLIGLAISPVALRLGDATSGPRWRRIRRGSNLACAVLRQPLADAVVAPAASAARFRALRPLLSTIHTAVWVYVATDQRGKCHASGTFWTFASVDTGRH